MPNYTISFDLHDSDSSVYSDLYLWIHSLGGYHYVLLAGNQWGRLPSTCVVFPVNTDDPFEAAAYFHKAVLEELGYEVSHSMAILGEPCGFSIPQAPPRYAVNRNLAVEQHKIRQFKRAIGIDPGPIR